MAKAWIPKVGFRQRGETREKEIFLTLLGTSLSELLGDWSYVAEHCSENRMGRVENRYGTGRRTEEYKEWKDGGRLKRRDSIESNYLFICFCIFTVLLMALKCLCFQRIDMNAWILRNVWYAELYWMYTCSGLPILKGYSTFFFFGNRLILPLPQS